MPTPSLPDLEFEAFWRSLLGPECYLVYHLYAGDELLYVGITSRFRGRLREHFERTEWARRVDRVECRGPYDEATARRLEKLWKRAGAPTYNATGRRAKPGVSLERARRISALVQGLQKRRQAPPPEPEPEQRRLTRAERAERTRAQIERARKISARVQKKPYIPLA